MNLRIPRLISLHDSVNAPAWPFRHIQAEALGSGRSRRFMSTTSSAQKSSRSRENITTLGATRAGTSSRRNAASARGTLFGELFPDAILDTTPSQEGNDTGTRGPKPGDHCVDVRPSIEREVLDKGDLHAWLETQRSQTGMNERSLPPRDYMPALLVLWNAPKSLAESDFYRIGRQGEHVYGWNGSIKKITQIFDSNTLEPLGSYFIHFTSRAAARAYKHQADALFGPVRHDTTQNAFAPSLYGPVPTDVALELGQKAFTLAPPSPAPLSLKLYALPTSTENRIRRSFTLEGILSGSPSIGSNMQSAPSNGSPPVPSSRDQLVILSLDGGAIETTALRGLLTEDGVYRNLAWDMTSLQPYFPQRRPRPQPGSNQPKNHAGTAKGKCMDEEIPRAAREKSCLATTRSAPIEHTGAKDGAGEGIGSDDSEVDIREAQVVKSARFILSFRDVHEARRFVRTWHRKELSVASPASDSESLPEQQMQYISVSATLPW